jgi:hypothetical protein
MLLERANDVTAHAVCHLALDPMTKLRISLIHAGAIIAVSNGLISLSGAILGSCWSETAWTRTLTAS